MATQSLAFHSRYFDHFEEWQKWRTVYAGGQQFIEDYLEKFSARESDGVFNKRKRLSPAASFASSSIDELRDAILNRLHLVRRIGGSEAYNAAIAGQGNGIDYHGNSMTTFMARSVLSELLIMSRVGVYMDMPQTLPEDRTAQANVTPYVYTYRREDILDWQELRDHPGRLAYVSLLDRPVTGPFTNVILNREMTLTDEGVLVKFYKPDADSQAILKLSKGEATSQFADKLKVEHLQEYDVLLEGFTEIPFWLVDIDKSMMKPVANHQIALLNLESSDIGYCLHANFPFYIEQQEGFSGHLNNDNDGTGTAAGAVSNGRREITVGANIGRSYTGKHAPEFIHPSSEPMRVSMEKQAQLKIDIRNLLHQQVTGLNPNKQQSADSKEFGERPLEAGLSYIGHAMQIGETALARFWTFYKTADSEAIVTYPSVWTLETDATRHDKANALNTLRVTVPSPTFQKAVSREIAKTLLTGCITQEEMDKIYGEIQNAPGVTADPDTIALMLEKSVLDKGNAAKLLGIPEKAPAIADEEHFERVKRIAEATQSASPATDVNSDGASKLREGERDPSTSVDGKPKQRGRGRQGRSRRAQEARTQ